MMTSKDRKGPKPSKRFKIVEEPSNPAQPTKPMTKQPKRLHIYKPEDVRGNRTGIIHPTDTWLQNLLHWIGN
jgi:hypothetical protein